MLSEGEIAFGENDFFDLCDLYMTFDPNWSCQKCTFIVTKCDIKLNGLSVIHRDIGRAVSLEKKIVPGDSRVQFFFKLIARPIYLCIMWKNPSNFIIIMFWESDLNHPDVFDKNGEKKLNHKIRKHYHGSKTTLVTTKYNRNHQKWDLCLKCW